LIGPSGGGKSTFLRTVGGLLAASSGRVCWRGAEIDMRDHGALLAHRRRFGFLFQGFQLFEHLDVLGNVARPLEVVHQMGRGEARERAIQELERFGVGGLGSRMPHQLSGGQQQRVALARALAPGPEALLLDEPTSALDPEITAEVLELLKGLAEGGQSILLSTHELGFARAVADGIVVVEGGEIVEWGEPERVFGRPEAAVTRRFLEKLGRFSC